MLTINLTFNTNEACALARTLAIGMARPNIVKQPQERCISEYNSLTATVFYDIADISNAYLSSDAFSSKMPLIFFYCQLQAALTKNFQASFINNSEYANICQSRYTCRPQTRTTAMQMHTQTQNTHGQCQCM